MSSETIASIIVLPFLLIIIAVLDYAAWQIFTAIADGSALLWMALLVILELAVLVNFVRRI